MKFSTVRYIFYNIFRGIRVNFIFFKFINIFHSSHQFVSVEHSIIALIIKFCINIIIYSFRRNVSCLNFTVYKGLIGKPCTFFQIGIVVILAGQKFQRPVTIRKNGSDLRAVVTKYGTDQSFQKGMGFKTSLLPLIGGRCPHGWLGTVNNSKNLIFIFKHVDTGSCHKSSHGMGNQDNLGILLQSLNKTA